jgi:hypothetical protein
VEDDPALLVDDFDDVVDADQEARSSEEACPHFERFGLVGAFAVADTRDPPDPLGRGFDQEAFAAA